MDWWHLLSRCTYLYLAQILLSPIKGCQRFRICCRHMSGKTDEPTILNTLTKVRVWNGGIFYLAAPISILPKFCYPPIKGCQRFCICCRHMSGKRDDPTILNALTKVGVWIGGIFYLAAPISILPKFCYPL